MAEQRRGITPGCLVRGSLATFGILFLPLSIWFAYANWHRYGFQAMMTALFALISLRWAFTKDPDSVITMIDDLGETKK